MGKKHQEGFTLIELLVLMMVFALTLGIGVPAFNGMVANARMSAAANDLVSSLHAARAEATTRNTSVTLCASTAGDAPLPACDADAVLTDGWVVFVDTNSDGAISDDETLLQGHGALDDSIRSRERSGAEPGPPYYLSFRGDGFLQEIAGLGPPVRNVQLCDARGNQDTGNGRAAGRWITVSPAGHPALVDRVKRLQADGNPLGGC